MSEKKKRNIIIGSLCGVLLLMVVGYAAFSTVLNINGTTAITSKWQVLITNITSKDIVGKASDEEFQVVDDLSATFKANLVSPGDSITYDITVENKGTFNAYLEKITINKKDNPAIIFETSGLKENDELAPDTSKILTIKVTYNPDITEDPEDKSADFKVTLDFGQQILAQSELVWDCPEEYTSSDEAGPDMICSKVITTNYTTSTEYYCSVGVLSGDKCYDQIRNCACYNATPVYYTTVAYNDSCRCSSGIVYGHECQYPFGAPAADYSRTCYMLASNRTIYSCSDGYTKSGDGTSTICSKTETTSPVQVTKYICPEGYTLQEDNTCNKE